jgi:recombination protein RecR
VTKIDYPEEIRLLIAQFKRLPGIGPRSAERIALWLLRSSQSPSADLARALTDASAGIRLCPSCGFFASLATGSVVGEITDLEHNVNFVV